MWWMIPVSFVTSTHNREMKKIVSLWMFTAHDQSRRKIEKLDEKSANGSDATIHVYANAQVVCDWNELPADVRRYVLIETTADTLYAAKFRSPLCTYHLCFVPFFHAVLCVAYANHIISWHAARCSTYAKWKQFLYNLSMAKPLTHSCVVLHVLNS